MEYPCSILKLNEVAHLPLQWWPRWLALTQYAMHDDLCQLLVGAAVELQQALLSEADRAAGSQGSVSVPFPVTDPSCAAAQPESCNGSNLQDI